MSTDKNFMGAVTVMMVVLFVMESGNSRSLAELEGLAREACSNVKYDLNFLSLLCNSERMIVSHTKMVWFMYKCL